MELNKDVLEDINNEVLKIGGDAKSDKYKYNIDVLKDILTNVETIAGSGGAGLNVVIVEELPTTGESHTIYLVPNSGTKPNIYDEYMYIANDWEKIGSTDIDLSNYYTKTQTDNLLDDKQDELTFDSTPTENSNNPVTSDGIFQALAGAGGGSDANVQYLGDVSKYDGSNNKVLDITGMKKGIYIINNDNNSAQYGSSICMKSNYNGSYKNFSVSYSQSRIKPYIFLELINDVPTTVTSNKVIGYVYEYQTYWGWWKGTITFKSSEVKIAGEFAGVQALYTDINRTVTGKLTFNTLPETSVTPTTDTQLVNKSYVDAQIQALREELSGE